MSGLTMAAAMAVTNVTTYGLTLLSARALGPAEFGQFSAVLGLLIIVNVLSLGLQATAARRVSADPRPGTQIGADITRVTAWSALGVFVLCALLSPAVGHLLGLSSWWSALMMAVAAGFLTLMGGLAGLLQGSQRWNALALVYVTLGVARLCLGATAFLVHSSTAGVMTGVAVAAAFPALVAWWCLRAPDDGRRARPIGAQPEAVDPHPQGRSVLREVAHSTHALFAFFALSNIDIVLARSILPEHDAGLYAAGLILTKAVLFLPQFVVIVAFPAMSQGHGGRGTHVLGLGLILALGSVAALIVAALPSLAMAFTGGASYRDNLPIYWQFAVLGTVLAMVQLLVYSALAQAHPRAVAILWCGLAAMVAVSLRVDEVLTLLHLKLLVDVLVLVVLLGVLLLRPGAAARPTTPIVDPPLAEDVASPEQPGIR
jgi:hypothetical protein